MIATLLAQVAHLKSHLVVKHRKRGLIIGMLFSWLRHAVDSLDQLSFTIHVRVASPLVPRVKVKSSIYSVPVTLNLQKRGDSGLFFSHFIFLKKFCHLCVG